VLNVLNAAGPSKMWIKMKNPKAPAATRVCSQAAFKAIASLVGHLAFFVLQDLLTNVRQLSPSLSR